MSLEIFTLLRKADSPIRPSSEYFVAFPPIFHDGGSGSRLCSSPGRDPAAEQTRKINHKSSSSSSQHELQRFNPFIFATSSLEIDSICIIEILRTGIIYSTSLGDTKKTKRLFFESFMGPRCGKNALDRMALNIGTVLVNAPYALHGHCDRFKNVVRHSLSNHTNRVHQVSLIDPVPFLH